MTTTTANKRKKTNKSKQKQTNKRQTQAQSQAQAQAQAKTQHAQLSTRLRSREPEKNSVWPLVNALLGVRRLDFGGYTLRLPLIGCIVANFIKLFFGEVTQDF